MNNDNFRSFPSISFAYRYVAPALVVVCLSTQAVAANWTVSKTEFGAPDLQGSWTSATITGLERVPQYGDKLVVSEEEAIAIESKSDLNVLREEDAKATDPNEGAPTDGDAGAGYNAFWLDPGSHLMRVDGEIRTSIIIDPANGKIPYTQKANMAFYQFAQGMGTAGPEQRPLGERCLVGFGSSGGPPMLPVLYNNNMQIVQSPGYVMILAEMNHDARIIRINDQHSDDAINPWLGDSIGHWDGNTLVVETVNFHPQQSFRFAVKHRLYLPADSKVTERFTRVSDEEIVYAFEIENDEAYTQNWKGEISLRSTDSKIFEYACHEGNYSLPGVLAGARLEEKEKQ